MLPVSKDCEEFTSQSGHLKTLLEHYKNLGHLDTKCKNFMKSVCLEQFAETNNSYIATVSNSIFPYCDRLLSADECRKLHPVHTLWQSRRHPSEESRPHSDVRQTDRRPH